MADVSKAFSWITALIIVACALFWSVPSAEACTAVYVGSDVSADGSIIIARSNDTQGVISNYIDVMERVENQQGRTMPINESKDVLADIPDTTYKCICTPFMDSGAAHKGTARDAAACINECGVAMTMSITAFSNKAVLDADPLIESGITEDTMDDYVVCQSATAREAVETLLAAIDKYGSSEINIALIADQNEAWWVEMYSGHQYAAVKLPSDKVSAFGNEFQLEFLSDYEDHIVSPGLESIPKEKGFAVYGDNGELNLFETYAGTAMNENYCHMRTWIGHQLLAPSVFKDDYDLSEHYPACFTPDKPVSVRDVMEFMRNRYEGTPYSPDETGRTDMRVIGTDTAMSVHIMQVFPQLPTEMSTLLWECPGPCIYGVFVPVSIACTKVSEAYARNQPAEEDGKFDVEHYPYYANKGLTTLCVEKDEYKVYGTPVREYWATAEEAMTATLESMLAEAATMDPADAAAYLESYCTGVQAKSFDDARKLLNDVVWYHGENSNTLKNGKNPETEEIYDELAPIDPMKVDLDASAYAQVPKSSDFDTAKLVIIHTNDSHGYDQEADGCFGMAAAAQLKADYKAMGYDVLLLDSGDALQGNILSDDSKGKVIPEFMNDSGYDAMALGNHEFDFGADVLQERMEACGFPVLCANITVDATGELFAQPNTVFTLSDGTKVGVFGIDTPETKTKSAPKNTSGLSFAANDDLYQCAQQQVDELRSQGCSLVICLGHLGELDTSAPNRASDVIANTEGIDLFIDGHDHKVENTTIKDKAGNDVLVLETGCHFANIGVVTYDGSTLKEELLVAGSYSGEDAKTKADIDAVAADIDSRMKVTVATTPFDLNGEASPGVRDSETNLGDLVTDAVRWEANQTLKEEPDLVIINGGSIRTSIDEGDITLIDIHNATPFSNQIYTLEITGAELLEALEAACQGSPEPMGSFPQVAGITYTLDVSKPYEKGKQYPGSTYFAPANPGSRITITDVNGKGFSEDAVYLLATNDFIATGGDTYYCLAKAAAEGMNTTGYTTYQAIQYYLSDEYKGTVPDTYKEPQGRITVVGN